MSDIPAQLRVITRIIMLTFVYVTDMIEKLAVEVILHHFEVDLWPTNSIYVRSCSG